MLKKLKNIDLETEYKQSLMFKIAYVYGNISDNKLYKLMLKLLNEYLSHQ